ncbi:HNH endonuclease signature motif containing protein [Amycolatopsis cihanbeyliensis]|uniref:HNH endonuclease n=1 Tax=Amycolatopsis cihanbeyliensis TaxID=1128664 RepID=UPI001151C222
MPWNTSNRKERLPTNWAEVRLTILRRDHYRCQIGDERCLGRATDVDHIRPGDDHRPVNLRAVCARCHARKSAREGNARRAQLRARYVRPAGRHPGTR